MDKKELDELHTAAQPCLSIQSYFCNGNPVDEARFDSWVEEIRKRMPPGASIIQLDTIEEATALLIQGACRLWETFQRESDVSFYQVFFAPVILDALEGKNTGDEILLEATRVDEVIILFYWIWAITAYCWQAIQEEDPAKQWRLIAISTLHFGLSESAISVKELDGYVTNRISKLAAERSGKGHIYNRDRKASALAWYSEQTGMSKNEAAPQISAAFNVTEGQARTWLQGDVSASLEKLRRGGANVITPWCERGRTIGS